SGNSKICHWPRRLGQLDDLQSAPGKMARDRLHTVADDRASEPRLLSLTRCEAALRTSRYGREHPSGGWTSQHSLYRFGFNASICRREIGAPEDVVSTLHARRGIIPASNLFLPTR